LTSYVAPSHALDAFNCPLCNAYSHQDWDRIYHQGHSRGEKNPLEEFRVAFCAHCNEFTLWFKDKMIFLVSNGAPLPHTDLPKDVRKIYEEARSIVSLSPRSSAALLRLAIEILTNNILRQQKGKDLFDNIRILVNKGLPDKVQKSLDVLRVVGNNCVHPGKIDSRDSYSIAISMFQLINTITDVLIREPKSVDELYDNLPKNSLDGIRKRNSK
jgi:hypothetical protein